MNLTMSSLKAGKDKCQQLESLKDLMMQSDKVDLLEEIRSLESAFDQCISVLERVHDIRDSLESFGYSDQWFDTINAGGSLEGIVEFDMPKLFDNKANKTQACMEGLWDTIKEWLLKAYNFLKSVILKIRDFVHWLLEKLGLCTSRKIGALDSAVKQGYGMMQAYFQQCGIDLQNFYDPDELVRYEMYLKAIVGTIFNRIRANISKEDISDRNLLKHEDIRKDFYDRLTVACKENGIELNNIEKVGYTIEYTPGSSKFLRTLGFATTGKDFKQTTIAIETVDDFVAKALEPLKKIDANFKESASLIKFVQNTIAADHASLGDSLNQMRANNMSEDIVVITQANVINQACCLSVVTDALNFFAEIQKRVAHNVNLLEAIIDVSTGKRKPPVQQ